MEILSSFLGKFKNLAPPERFVKDACINAVEKKTGIRLSQNEIDIAGDTLLITASPAKKTDLILHKSAILSELQTALSSYRKTIKDIK